MSPAPSVAATHYPLGILFLYDMVLGAHLEGSAPLVAPRSSVRYAVGMDRKLTVYMTD